MLLPQIVEKFANLVFKNQELLDNNLKALAGGLFAPLDRDSLKSDLERMLKIRISSVNYNNWKEINESHVKKLTDGFWTDFEPNSILYTPTGGSEAWIITKNLKELKSYYENPEESQDLHIHQVILLQNQGPIPNLYLIHGDLESAFDPSEPEQESPEIAHNLFIVEALRKFYGPLPKEDINQFLTENKKIINSLKSSFEQQPRVLGEGADGITFSIGPNLVLKIFEEEHSYVKAKEAQERLWKNPRAARTEAMIYDVGVLGQLYNYPLYYYIIQKMKPVRDNLTSDTEIIIELIVKNVFKFITENRDDIFLPLKQSFRSKPNMAKLNNTIKSISRSLSLQIFEYIGQSDIQEVKRDVKDTFNIILRDDWLRMLVEEVIMKYLTSRTDLHTGNIGVTPNGYLRYFDPAHPSSVTAPA